MTLDSDTGSTTNNVVYTALPTASVVNTNGIFGSGNYVMYCFRSIPGVSRCGYYTGNGSSDGPFLNMGFTSRFVLIKSLSTGGWNMYDTVRDEVQPLDKFLVANSAATETTDTRPIDVLAQGVRIRTTDAELNTDGQKYFYMAMADVATGVDLPPLPGR